MADKKTFEFNSGIAQKGLIALENFVEATKNPKERSEALFQKIINDNKDTEYGKKYDFASIKTIQDYQQKVPVIVYDDVYDYVERMKEGEKNILTSYEVKRFLLTSGTDKKPKHIPFSEIQMEKTAALSSVPSGVIEKYCDAKYKEGHFFSPTEAGYSMLPSGYFVGSATASLVKSAAEGLEPYATMLSSLYTSPVEALTPHEGNDSMYVHTRFALMQEDLTAIVCAFASYLAQCLIYIYNNIDLLIDDIEKGTISDDVQIDENYRNELAKYLKPMPERAAFLRKAFENKDDQFVTKVWPNICYVRCVAGDGFSTYTDMIRTRFLGKDIPIIYSGISSSEGIFSVPIEFNNDKSVLLFENNFMEYLPVEAGNDFSKITTIDKLEVGKAYELIITNLSGLYRYRMGDVVKVGGYYNKTPMVEFLYRTNKTINIAGEKTTETQLKNCVKATVKDLGVELLDYAVYPDRSTMPAKYIFLIETYSEKRHDISKEKLSECITKNLYAANPMYEYCLGHLEAPIAYWQQPETQFLYRDLMVLKGTNASQCKPVHVITKEEQRKFFMGMIEE